MKNLEKKALALFAITVLTVLQVSAAPSKLSDIAASLKTFFTPKKIDCVVEDRLLESYMLATVTKSSTDTENKSLTSLKLLNDYLFGKTDSSGVAVSDTATKAILNKYMNGSSEDDKLQLSALEQPVAFAADLEEELDNENYSKNIDCVVEDIIITKY